LIVVNARVKKVVDEFLELTPEERELAIDEIEANLEEQDTPEEVEKAWNEEIARRIEDVETGRVKTKPLDEVISKLRARYSR
jgi:putative addiction module component (TIGR02574 family)